MSNERDKEYEELTSGEMRVCDCQSNCLYMILSGHNDEDVKIPAHWHEWVELIHVIEGEMDLNTLGNKQMIKSGDYVLIGSQVLHEIVGKVGDYTFETLHLNIGVITKYLNMSIFMNEVLIVEDKETLTKNLTELVSLIEKDDTVSSLKYRAYVELVIAQLAGEIMANKKDGGTDKKLDESFNRILFYVNEHLNENISMSEVANVFSITPQYLSSLFKKNLDTTFLNYVTKNRLDRAKFMLYSSDEKVIDIAFACGFPSDHAFIQQFKKFNGMTPIEYRKTKVF